jgi:hypothetical protein
MIVVMELLALIAAVVVAVAGVASNSGSIQPLSDNFVIPGQRLNGLSIRQPVSYGIAVHLVVLLRPGTRKRLRAPAAGQTRVIYETRQLGSVNEAIQEVVQGKARARLVLAP